MDEKDLYQDQPTIENPSERPKGRLVFSLLTVIFCFLIFAGGIALFTDEDKSFSQAENRVLATMPELSLYSLKDGSFMKDFETYLTDQFPFRDEIIRLKTVVDRAMGKTEVGGVYIGDDGYLFSVPSVFDEKAIEALTNKLTAFCESNSDSRISFMLSPNSSYVYKEKLPERLILADQSYLIDDIANYTDSENIDFINLCAVFNENKDEQQLFYRTDHHWTTRAAHIAFLELMKKWEKDVSNTTFTFLTAADGFQGTLSSKAGVMTSDDIIEICVPEGAELTYVVDYEDGEKRSATLFDASKLKEKNKYEVFCGGNYGKITVSTTSAYEDTLLIVKDSYANCLLPMLTPFFSTIVVVDPRYGDKDLSSLMEEESFSHILFLYNLDTLLEDTSLVEVLE